MWNAPHKLRLFTRFVRAVAFLLLSYSLLTFFFGPTTSRPSITAASGSHEAVPTDIRSSKSYDFSTKATIQLTDLERHFSPTAAQACLAKDRLGTSKRVIAMALYGDRVQYLHGALENALLVRRDWKDSKWVLRIYHDASVPSDVLDLLDALGVELVELPQTTDHAGLFWRFYVLQDPEVCRYIIRDTDSRLTRRDLATVSAWVASDAYFHMIRDHNFHGIAIMGAMWGAVGGFLNKDILEAYQNSSKPTGFNQDQLFLRDNVWPVAKNYALVHDAYFCKNVDLKAKDWRPIPVQRRSPTDFIGNAYTEENGYEGMKLNEECPLDCRKEPSWTYC